MTDPRPPRVRITHPRTESVRSVPRRATITELDEQTRLGEVYLDSLVRSQRRLAVGVCLTVAVLLGGLALLGGYVGGFAHTRLFGIPLPWLALGVVVYPVLIGLGWLTVRRAEHNEAEFVDLVRHR